jgi:hypothetical protein
MISHFSRWMLTLSLTCLAGPGPTGEQDKSVCLSVIAISELTAALNRTMGRRDGWTIVIFGRPAVGFCNFGCLCNVMCFVLSRKVIVRLYSRTWLSDEWSVYASRSYRAQIPFLSKLRGAERDIAPSRLRVRGLATSLENGRVVNGRKDVLHEFTTSCRA